MVQYTSVGVHVAGSGTVGDLIERAARLHKAGRPIPAIVVVNDGGLCSLIKSASPSTYVVFRGNVKGGAEGDPFEGLKDDGSGSTADPVAWYQRMKQYNSQAPHADAYSLYNERTFGNNSQSLEYARKVAAFDLATMIEAEKDGVKIAFGNHWPGTPEKDHINAMGDMVAHAEEHDHPVIYHAYSKQFDDASFLTDATYYAARPMRVYADYPNLRFIMGEAGHFNSPRYRGVDDMIRMWEELDALYMPYILKGWRIAACYWTICGQNPDGGWQADDWTPQLDVYERWMTSRTAAGESLRAPVGETGVDGTLTPAGWFDANPIGTLYTGPTGNAYHTGADLNKNTPGWDADAHARIYAIADGIVTTSADYGVWGRIIVIKHGSVYARYAHVETPRVVKGQVVKRGDYIANVGNAYGQQAYHLHFDISPTDILARIPNHWPKLDLDSANGLRKNYIDPAKYIREGSVPTPKPSFEVIIFNNLNVREKPNTTSRVLTVYKAGRIVQAFDYDNEWFELATANGYINKCCADKYEAPIIHTVWITASPRLNVRQSTSTTSPIIGTLDYGSSWAVNETGVEGWYKLQTQAGYIAKQWTQDTPVEPAKPVWKMPITADMRGVHASAGGWAPQPRELSLAKASGVKWAFIAAYQHNQQTAIANFVNNGVSQFVVRSCVSGAVGNAARFAGDTIPILKQYQAAIDGTMMVMIHNEPNLYDEGAGTYWMDGKAFADWWTIVRDLYKGELPNAKFGFPAMSPGGAVPNVRLAEALFVNQSMPAILKADFIGVHYYWQNADGTDIAPPVDNWRNWFGNKPILATEVGPVNGLLATGAAYQRAYSRFAAANIPMAAWLLSGAGAWQNADWVANNIIVPL